ncbi:hypothetical protein SRHO_G00116930 [Serrasalmus rhombeus]
MLPHKGKPKNEKNLEVIQKPQGVYGPDEEVMAPERWLRLPPQGRREASEEQRRGTDNSKDVNSRSRGVESPAKEEVRE